MIIRFHRKQEKKEEDYRLIEDSISELRMSGYVTHFCTSNSPDDTA